MTRLLTLVGYGVLAACSVGLELAARRSRRLATFGDALDVVLRRWPVRAALLAGWLWLGWHLFVRADWR
ncbi:MAG TPA: DUF6186 family protein [Acidimicrobiales bacterium]|nr:DUF6186 family protein [Acidimicrobiales bacterium]